MSQVYSKEADKPSGLIVETMHSHQRRSLAFMTNLELSRAGPKVMRTSRLRANATTPSKHYFLRESSFVDMTPWLNDTVPTRAGVLADAAGMGKVRELQRSLI